MTGFALLVVALGIFLVLRPDAWWRLNAPVGEKGKDPGARYLRGVRIRGITFTLGGIALLVVQYIKALP